MGAKVRAVQMVHTGAIIAASLGWERLSVALAAIIGVTVLTITGHVASDAAVGLYASILGYVLGRSAERSEAEG